MANRPSVQVKFARTWVQEVLGKADPRLRAAAGAAMAYQKSHIPVSADGSHGRPAGYARDRIHITVVLSHEGAKVYQVGTDATTPDGFPYPAVLDAGAPPHEIESHGNYPLRNKETGKVFGKRVMHPGYPGTNWCRGSLSAVRVVL